MTTDTETKKAVAEAKLLRPVGEVFSAWPWKENCVMMAEAVAPLGFIGDRVIDLTLGPEQGFWKPPMHRPRLLVTNDLYQSTAEHHVDVRGAVPIEWLGQFDTSLVDLPYKMNGTPDMGDMDHRFGTDKAGAIEPADTEAKILEQLDAGTRFALDCVKVKGFALVKCQDQVCSQRMVYQTHRLTRVAEDHGAVLAAQFLKLYRPIPQPAEKQDHPRSNFSTLLVFRKRTTVQAGLFD